MMRKVMLFLALASLLLVTAGCGGSKSSSGSSATQSVEVGAPLKTVIESYFTQYFDSQKSLSYTAMSNTLLAENDNTQLNEAFREVLINQDKLLNTGMRTYQYQLDYRKCAVSGNTATIELKLNLDFEYQNAPTNCKSGVYGVNYTITLQNNGSAWVIAGIDSDWDTFVAFKALVAEKKSLSAQVQTSAIDQAKANLINQLTRMSQSSLLMQGASSGASTASDNGAAASPSPTPTATTAITNSVYVSCNTYDYKATSAVNYAQAFAKAAQSSRVFCTWTDADCTNFVSQCIWAGYVGYTSASDSRTKMNNRSGMIYPDWFAGASNASASDYAKNWVAVDELWAYITNNSKTAGPKAVGYNNGKVYTGVAAKDINVGDILQFSKGSATDYLHSVVVTRKNANTYNDILVSYHSTDTLDNALSSVITWAGGEKCFMRRLVPQSGCYMK